MEDKIEKLESQIIALNERLSYLEKDVENLLEEKEKRDSDLKNRPLSDR